MHRDLIDEMIGNKEGRRLWHLVNLRDQMADGGDAAVLKGATDALAEYDPATVARVEHNLAFLAALSGAADPAELADDLVAFESFGMDPEDPDLLATLKSKPDFVKAWGGQAALDRLNARKGTS